MSSFTDLGIAASRARGAASPSTELLEPGAKRLRKRPAGGNAPLLGGAVSRDVDAAVQIGAVDVSATATPSHVVEDPVQVQRYDRASIETNSDKIDSSEDALAERLVLVLTRCSTFPAKSGLLSIDTDFTLGLLKAVEEGVEQAWRTRKAELPAESGLKHKSFAWLAADLLGDPFLPSGNSSRQVF